MIRHRNRPPCNRPQVSIPVAEVLTAEAFGDPNQIPFTSTAQTRGQILRQQTLHHVSATSSPQFRHLHSPPDHTSGVSHKTIMFDMTLEQATLQLSTCVYQLRHLGTLTKFRSPQQLRCMDRSCGNRRCIMCPLLCHPSFVTSTALQTTHPVDADLNCLSPGVVYLLTCHHYSKQYIGETNSTMRQRLQSTDSTSRELRCLCMHISSGTITPTHWTYPLYLSAERRNKERRRRKRQWITCLGSTIPKGLNNK